MKILDVKPEYKNFKKVDFKAYALMKIRCISSCEWSGFLMKGYLNKPDVPKEFKRMAEIGMNMNEYMMEEDLKALFEYLKGYFQND